LPSISAQSRGDISGIGGDSKRPSNSSQRTFLYDVINCAFDAGRIIMIGNKRVPLYNPDTVLGSVFKVAIATLTEHVRLLTVSKAVYTHLNGVVQFLHSLSAVFLKPDLYSVQAYHDTTTNWLSTPSSSNVNTLVSYCSLCESTINNLVDSFNMALLSRFADANDFSVILSGSSSSTSINSTQINSKYLSETQQSSMLI
jgi:hypothetical protein